MKILFLVDPLSTLNIKKDTSFALMLSAHLKTHEVYYLSKSGISLSPHGLEFHVTQIIPKDHPDTPFKCIQNRTIPANQVDALFIRTDPPFDDTYLLHTWLLNHMPTSCFIINNPSGIRTVNEKIWVTKFRDLTPETVITQNKNLFLTFLKKHPNIIAKPYNHFGGQGIFKIHQKDPNKHVIFETLTDNGKKPVILQPFIKDAQNGDKRVLLLNGNPLGALLRVNNKEDHRNNFFSGGTPLPTTLTQRDLKIIQTIKPHLIKLGLYFVGIDIIGDYLIEVNVTSPTCLREMNQLYHQQLEDKVIEFIETQKKEKT